MVQCLFLRYLCKTGQYNSAFFMLRLASRWIVIIQLLPIFLSGLPTLFSFCGYFSHSRLYNKFRTIHLSKLQTSGFLPCRPNLWCVHTYARTWTMTCQSFWIEATRACLWFKSCIFDTCWRTVRGFFFAPMNISTTSWFWGSSQENNRYLDKYNCFKEGQIWDVDHLTYCFEGSFWETSLTT